MTHFEEVVASTLKHEIKHSQNNQLLHLRYLIGMTTKAHVLTELHLSLLLLFP